MRLSILLASTTLLLAATAGAQGGPAQSTASPVPATNPATWVLPEDYPAWAVRYETTGRVGVRVDVDIDGRVTRCHITRSSGVPDLDVIACKKVSERARFVPALDRKGKPVPGAWSSTVVWQMPDDEDDGIGAAPQPGFLLLTMVVEPDGTVSECRVERAEGEAAGMFPDECPAGQRFEPILDGDGNPQRTRIRMTMSLEHEAIPE